MAGGRTPTGRDAIEWASEGVERGAGEILLTSMDRDGTKDGYELTLTRAIAKAVEVPVIASGGVGNPQHLVDGLKAAPTPSSPPGSSTTAATAIPEVKEALQRAGFPMRPSVFGGPERVQRRVAGRGRSCARRR